MSQITVIMGSKSDLPIVKSAFDVFHEFGIDFSARILSAHRTPDEVIEVAKDAEKNGTRIFICAAGMAAHLGGVIAAHTICPVIGIPISSPPFNALDSLLSIVQMPPGIPVAAVTAGNAGGKNAALLAIEMLAIGNESLSRKLKDFRRKQAQKVIDDDKNLQQDLIKQIL